ncbi:MAG: hypothetical protein DDG59_13325 [Anaerolineae bacterium]|jgi:DNA-binding transcriptional ArsR family regulator/NAD-dependent dihydropyrimidine dehydrogenase PreA subunit|nr:MAG: hypothetical protein DDG59_13325 [Anaerolineae bacterium]
MVYDRQSNILQGLAHPVRLQILSELAVRPLCVCKLMVLTGRRQAYISQQLILLRQLGLVNAHREGLSVYYQLNDEHLQELETFLQKLINKLQSQPAFHQGAKLMSQEQMKSNVWHEIPRSEIAWYPTIVTDRCIGCGMCATSCGRGVYAFDYEANHPVVVEPQMCMVGCTTCATICLYDAIEFPSVGWIRQLIREKKVLRQSKGLLKQYPEKYDVRLRRNAVVK